MLDMYHLCRGISRRAYLAMMRIIYIDLAVTYCLLPELSCHEVRFMRGGGESNLAFFAHFHHDFVRYLRFFLCLENWSSRIHRKNRSSEACERLAK